MELEVPNQITYSSTHAQLTLLNVDESTDELSTKGIVTSVSTPAFISFSGFVSRSVTISVTDPAGGTVNYKSADTIAGEAASDTVGCAPVPELGYFSSYSSIDSLATLASHEDLASLASALAPAPITVIVTPPVTGPTMDGHALDVDVGPQQPQHAQHIQRFLQFQETQQARYAELFDDGVDDEDFDFFDYGRHYAKPLEEREDVEEVVDAVTAETDEWVSHQEAAHVPFLVPIINNPRIDFPAIHEPDTKDNVKDRDIDADNGADKENHNPLGVTSTIVKGPEVIHEDKEDAKLPTLETYESPFAHYLDLKFTLDGELDFGFDFNCVIDEIVACSLGSPSNPITNPAATEAIILIEKVSEPVTAAGPTSTPALIAYPNFTVTRSPTDSSPYSSPSVYSTESAPHSPYPFATPQIGQQSKAPCSPAATSPSASELTSVPASAFDAYDPTCFDGLGFESLDLRLHADGSVQVVFDAGEDDADAHSGKKGVDEGVNVETRTEKEDKQKDIRNERGSGDDSFSRFEVEQLEKHVDNLHQREFGIEKGAKRQADVKLLKDMAMVDKGTRMAATDEAFENWRRACLALATFAHVPVKTDILKSAKEHSHHEREEQDQADIFMVGPTGAIEVFGVTVSDFTDMVDAIVMTDAATTFTSQSKVEPAGAPSVLCENSVSVKVTSAVAASDSEEATAEKDEAHDVCPPADDIVSFIYSIPGPECMPSFAAVITEHLSPTPAPAPTPSSSFDIPVASTLDDCALLSEPIPVTIQSSSSDSLHASTVSQSSNMLDAQNLPSSDIDNMPSLLAEPSPFSALADASIHSSSSFRSYDMVVSDDIDGPARSRLSSEVEMETATEPSQTGTLEFYTEIGSLVTDLSNIPLHTIVEEPEDETDAQCAELIKSLAELAPDIDDVESDGDSDFEPETIASSPLLTVYEELAGGPQHLFNSLPRYARRSLDSIALPWLASLSSLASLGGRSSVANGHQEGGQSAHSAQVTSPDAPSISSSAAPAAAPEDDSWSPVAFLQPASPLLLQTPLRPLAGPSSFADAPLSTPSPAIRKMNRSGFFMSRMTFCPSPSPKRPCTSSPGSPTCPPSAPVSASSPAPTPVGTQARSGGRLRLMLRKLKTFSKAHLGVSLL